MQHPFSVNALNRLETPTTTIREFIPHSIHDLEFINNFRFLSYTKQRGLLMPIEKEKFVNVSSNLEAEIVSFLKARKGKAFTAEEIMGSTSFHVDFDLPITSKVSAFVAANFVAVLHELVSKGQIARKVVNNRMYFIAVE
jgi:hypothetical protein